ncbi:haloacid dehalogenase [Enterococcus florum]|uniref:Haloacid dehalogenase n=1 Tax=Enterococcus florum TaxID=2480627 RepID=A0A4P5P9K8_9ENTE|nr:HAD family phosphatase [Enterococcus florum]GCF92162.1 haloacid dehalogenase [Enterococcus florum]
MKGVVFDFNGTLFRDSAYHESAWQTFISQETDRKLTKEDFEYHIHGVNNQFALEYIFQRSLQLDEMEELAERKEKIYRDNVLALTDGNTLIKGVPELLDFLHEKQIPVNIATASMEANVRFYFNFFDLGRWFEYDKVVFNDGTVKSKPDPDFYVKASKNIAIAPKDVVVFEDSYSGLKAAENAGAGRIFAVTTDDNRPELEAIDFVDKVVDDFTDPAIYDLFH